MFFSKQGAKVNRGNGKPRGPIEAVWGSIPGNRRKSNTESSPFRPRRNRTKLVACNNSRQYRRGRVSSTIIVKGSWKRWLMRKRRSGPISTKGRKTWGFPQPATAVQRRWCQTNQGCDMVWNGTEDCQSDHGGSYCRANSVTQTPSARETILRQKECNRDPNTVETERQPGSQLEGLTASQLKSWIPGYTVKQSWGLCLYRSYSHRRSSTNLVEVCCRCGHQRGSLESWLWRHPKHRTRPWPQENLCCPTRLAKDPVLQFCHYATTTRLSKIVWKRRNIKRQRCVFPTSMASNVPSHPRIANMPTQIGEDQWL